MLKKKQKKQENIETGTFIRFSVFGGTDLCNPMNLLFPICQELIDNFWDHLYLETNL